MITKERIGAELRIIRKRLKKSQQDVSWDMEIGLSTYKQMENGEGNVGIDFYIKAWNYLTIEVYFKT